MNRSVSTETLGRLKAGDHKAFEEVFIAYYDKVKRLIDGYIKSEEDAEELTEELFVNLWDCHCSINTAKSFNAFMHTAARNISMNFLRHQHVHHSYIDHHSDIQYAATSEEEFIAKELDMLIELVVDRMPEQRKQIYRLSRTEGLSNGEIAERLNTTKRTVESQLSMALKEIRKYIMLFLLLMN